MEIQLAWRIITIVISESFESTKSTIYPSCLLSTGFKRTKITKRKIIENFYYTTFVILNFFQNTYDVCECDIFLHYSTVTHINVSDFMSGMQKCQMDLENNSPKTGYRLHSKFKLTIGKLNCQTKGKCSTDSSAVVSGNCLSNSKQG